MKKSTSGFTIVELLIVIVVIAILAAITVVAFTGIQDRAKNAALLSAFDASEKALVLYKEFNGDYPAVTDLPSGAIYACISSNYLATASFPNASNGAGSCMTINGEVYGARSAQLDAALKSSLSSIPDTSSLVVNDGPVQYRGVFYYPPAKSLAYVVKGDQTCGRGKPSVGPGNSGAQLTVCEKQLP